MAAGGGSQIYTSGGWPNETDARLHDDELMALTDAELYPIVFENMDRVITLTGGRMPYVADGDPGIWREWIRVTCGRILRERLGLKTHSGWKYQEYLFRLPRSGRSLTADDIGSLGLARRAKLAWKVLQEIRTKHQRPDIKLLIGIPFPTGLAIFTSIYLNDRAFMEATVREIREILETIPAEEVLFSLELPFEQITVAIASTIGLGDWTARLYARKLRSMLELLPEDVRRRIKFGLHACWGDLNGESMVDFLVARYLRFLPRRWRQAIRRRVQHPRNVVRFVGALLDEAPGNIRVAQIPLAAGNEAPPLDDPEYYRVLLNLLPYRRSGIEFVAGWAHEGLTPSQVQAVRSILQAAVGPELFSFEGPRCGLSRHAGDAEQVLLQPLQDTA